MFETIACSSKLVEPITIVGLLLAAEAGADAAGIASVAARAVRPAKAPAARERVETHGGHPFVVCDSTAAVR